ncbi:MAG TPA: FliA/WhiG family RNA polymerase sigma factor [Acidobacteriaceae bacterium]|jgi:RNA polymerase sigma factor for flagellar operon FliA|nr:FliA/WhiG family RNA polymerase sigma factor [Acidobacteriaceae bacterium]
MRTVPEPTLSGQPEPNGISPLLAASPTPALPIKPVSVPSLSAKSATAKSALEKPAMKNPAMERSRPAWPSASDARESAGQREAGAASNLSADLSADFTADLSSDTMLDLSEDAVASLLEDTAPASSRPFAELDAVAREELLLEHLPVVRYIARRIHERLPQHVEMDDLVSAGMVGLLDAFNKFDTGKNVQFRSYAQFRVRGAILDSLRTLDWSPRDLRRKGRAIEEAMHTLTARLGRMPSENEIATELSISLLEYQQLLGELKGLEIGSLHVEHTEDSGEEELAYVPNSPEEDPLFRCLKSEMRDRLASAIGELPEKERLVLTLYYYEEMTMKEIGLTLGVVESRVSQIHSSAVLRLRTRLAQGAKSTAAASQQRRPMGRVRRPGEAASNKPKPDRTQKLW